MDSLALEVGDCVIIQILHSGHGREEGSEGVEAAAVPKTCVIWLACSKKLNYIDHTVRDLEKGTAITKLKLRSNITNKDALSVIDKLAEEFTTNHLTLTKIGVVDHQYFMEKIYDGIMENIRNYEEYLMGVEVAYHTPTKQHPSNQRHSRHSTGSRK
ncbi:uncharacterized protein LOC111593537 [Drosophila hydei]|uniref:Uncharacterized protein LOC111593537 n=1 Tax=Drosophila hydei TaxID=7224 RepID=A0A6J2SWY8_DROHY|nr:uncharacterized protein LOC111593537 [Drosophila hydei]